MEYTVLKKDYISGTPILGNDGYWHIEWTHENGEKSITSWAVCTFEHALLCIKHIMGRE